MDIVLNIDIKDIDLTEKIGAYYDEDGDLIGGKSVADAVVAKLVAQATKGDYSSSLKQRVQEIRDEEIRCRIAATVDGALAEPINLTNSYGQRTGQTVTLTELIMQAAEKWLSETERDRRTDRSERRINLLVRTQVDEALKTEIAEAVRAAKDAVAKQLGKSVSDVVTEAVRAGLTAR